jgi:glutathione synthase
VNQTLVIIGDSLSTLKVSGDTSLSLVEAALRKNWTVFWCETNSVAMLNGEVFFQNCKQIKIDSQFESYIYDSTFNLNQSINLLEKCLKPENLNTRVSLHEAKAQLVLVRTDPPFNDQYRNLCWTLSLIPNQRKIWNAPKALLTLHEKLLPYAALQLGILSASQIAPTLQFNLGNSLHSAKDFLGQLSSQNKHKSGFVVKPFDGHGGNGIQFFNTDSEVLSFLNEVKTSVLIQPMLPEVKSTGDKRIFVSGGKLMFAFSRLPAENKIASNLAQGGRAILCELTPNQKLISEKLAAWLAECSVSLAGIDMIGDTVNEINITSPTGVRAYESLTHENTHAPVFDALLLHAQLHFNQ